MRLPDGVKLLNAGIHTHTHTHTHTPGLGISTAMTLSGSLASLVLVFSQAEKAMIAVERIQTCEDALPCDEGMDIDMHPSRMHAHDDGCHVHMSGDLHFENVSLRYSRALGGEMCVLKNVDLCVRKGEHVCIVGRTGSGKSSLVSTVLLSLGGVVTGKVYRSLFLIFFV